MVDWNSATRTGGHIEQVDQEEQHEVLHKKNDNTKRGHCRGNVLVAHADKVLFKLAAIRVGDN